MSVLFYHLTRQPLESTLPMLLGKSLERGWRVAVRGTKAERMRWLDERLWLMGEESFLPHGLAGGGFDGDQPVLLTTQSDMPNAPDCLMLVDGADFAPQDAQGLERVCILFDGNDPDAVTLARRQWKATTEAQLKAQYWSEESGRWQMKAET